MRQSDPTIERTWRFDQTTWKNGPIPGIMGIVNVTPDSFSDGGCWIAPERAIEHGLMLVEQGADILDIGGESTRPGASPVSEDEEILRVRPVIEGLVKQTNAPISIDTMKASVAKVALDAGAKIINDVSGFDFDSEMIHVASRSECGVIIMHMLGTPQTMQDDPVYDDVVREVSEYLSARVDAISQSGIDPERIVIDPGIGFGKTAEHNLELLTNIRRLHDTGRPVLIGHSRKRFLGKLIGRKLEERLAGTVGVSIALAQQSVKLIRVHDVASVKDALIAWKKLQTND
ncbi:Dihydropteroate synthase [Thalassoglobus neptunius]|uniref:Dihydropteroate synthase n=1 Tax=Thalassoglobus neptunius TaxID=1938619 RepID=A0A5C5X402_9PLAN|nr:dihydropteroate synthase [Thalassoglobus neptunius]TWT57051.1 Dihydropteroate synthase [Thalassoglobus neptunius]